ncbi:39S ribosomal protein L54, mitochondrial [Colletes gigas]|uniref:39S ribosomal protein L54, mitochondrial n=1 Tax=Colletes gigas TaxID=935657 RepID=UPI001C9BA437|nr:39S ribosomal protein L54, mitochondrial [Colletes gigas]
MSLLSALRLFHLRESFIIPVQYAIQAKGYQKPSGKHSGFGKKIIVKKTASIPVEKDINKLLTYVCGTNILKEGEDVKLKPDSEYPEWLWNITTQPIKLSELDPNTKEYWRYLRTHGLKRNNRTRKYFRFH